MMLSFAMYPLFVGTIIHLANKYSSMLDKMSPEDLENTFRIRNLITQPHKANMELLAFLAWLIILGFLLFLTLLALKFITIRVVLVVLAFLPFLFIFLFFIFRHAQLTNEEHKTAYFTNWKIGGHRGSSHDGIPENSLEAMTAVKKEGGQVAEMDIQITSDGIPVICHDTNVVRVTGVDKDISKMTLAEFKDLRHLGTNVSLPTFAEAVAHCVSQDIMMIWDVKNVNEALLKEFVIQIRTHNLYAKVMISAFNPVDTYMVKMADPKILTGFTWRSWELSTTDEGATISRFSGVLNAIAITLDIFAYGLAKSLIMPKFLGSDMIFYHVNDASMYLQKSALDNNMYLGVWTSNNKFEMAWLKDYLGVPFLTDNVGLAPKPVKAG